MRGIQYAAAFRLYHRRLWDTGSSAFADDDSGGVAHSHASQRPVIPAKRGSSTPRLIDSIAGVSEYWVPAFAGTTVGVCQTHHRDLAARCVRGLLKTSALKTEGVGNGGRPMHPQPRVRYW